MPESVPQSDAERKTMRAARVMQQSDEKYTLGGVPRPEVKPGHVLIRMKVAGYCHTDSLTAEGFYNAPFPIIGGHEIAGVVEEIAEDVTSIAVGDRVVALNKVYECDCRKYNPAYCPNGKLAGLHDDGCFSEFFLALAHNTVKIPDATSFEQAAPMTCAGVTIYNAIIRATAGLEEGAVIGITGLGALGHIGVQIAKAMGYFVVGIDARSGPLELCRGFPLAPDLLVDSSQMSVSDAQDSIQAELQRVGRTVDRFVGVDAIIVTAEVQKALDFSLDLLARKGRYVLLSQPAKISIPSQDLIFKDITVIGSLQGDPKLLREVLELCNKHSILVTTKSWKFEDINEMLEHQKSSRSLGKALIAFE